MSQASRARRQHVINRLEELRAKLGNLEDCGPPEAIDGDPSWGPLGSLAHLALDPDEYQRLLRAHEAAVALERSRQIAGSEDTAGDPEPASQRAHAGVQPLL